MCVCVCVCVEYADCNETEKLDFPDITTFGRG